MLTKCIILLVVLTFIMVNVSTVEETGGTICTQLCIRLPENCTREGGAIKRLGPCCDSCVFTVGACEFCGYNSTSLAVQECGCNLQCDKEDKVCKPVKRKHHCHCSSSSSSSSEEDDE